MPNLPAKSVHPLIQRTKKLLHEEIWHHSVIADRSPRGRSFAALRVLSITCKGTYKNKIFSQAAALAYSSLMSLGPVVVLAVIISSFFLQKNSDRLASVFLDKVVTFIAPPTEEFSQVDMNSTENTGLASPATTQPNARPSLTSAAATTTTAPGDASLSTPEKGVKIQKSDIVKLIDQLVMAASRSKTVGVAGLLVLVFICIQLIITIENNFNNIWGVRRGRGLVRRVVLYLTVFCLGVLVAFTAGTLLSPAVLKNLPLGLNVLSTIKFLPKVLSFLLVASLLSIFYHFIPNTKVRWGPALMGGMVVSTLLMLNNSLTFLYVRQVLSAKSLFGSIGIILMLMFGLYIFWMLVLIGGQLTFALQNADNITDDRLWDQVSPRTRRLLSLAAFLQVARASVRQLPGPTSEELANTLRVPANILNQCLTRLTDLHLIRSVQKSDEQKALEIRFQPGQPLHQLSLGQFHQSLDILGNSSADETLEVSDPVLPRYLAALAHFEDGPTLNLSFADLLAGEKSADTAPARA